MQPLVSVIIPVYNAESTLRECLESVLQQGTRLEVLCVDDGSTDGSLALLREYEARDDRIRVYTQKNQYAGVARNRGIAHARGAYLAFLDADDVFLPGILHELYAQAEQQGLDFIKAGYAYYDAKTGRTWRTAESKNGSIPQRSRRRILSFDEMPWQLLYVPDVPWNGLYRRAFLEDNGVRFNSLQCVNDHSFYIHCLLRAERIMVTTACAVRYRISQSGSLIGRKADHFDAQIDSFRIVEALCADESPERKQILLQHELNSLFGWYETLAARTPHPELLREQLAAFLQTFDEDAVGERFLRTRPYFGTYWALRYGTEPPERLEQPPVRRILQSLDRHGPEYTWEQVRKKIKGMGQDK